MPASVAITHHRICYGINDATATRAMLREKHHSLERCIKRQLAWFFVIMVLASLNWLITCPEL